MNNDDRSTHKLFDEMLALNPTDEDIKNLYADLNHVFGSTFDEKINEAILNRGAVYIELPQILPN